MSGKTYEKAKGVVAGTWTGPIGPTLVSEQVLGTAGMGHLGAIRRDCRAGSNGDSAVKELISLAETRSSPFDRH